MAKAEAADAADIPDGMSIPDELARREERLRKIAEARTKIAPGSLGHCPSCLSLPPDPHETKGCAQ